MVFFFFGLRTCFSSLDNAFHFWPKRRVASPRLSLDNWSLILSRSNRQYKKKTLPGPLGAFGSRFLRAGVVVVVPFSWFWWCLDNPFDLPPLARLPGVFNKVSFYKIGVSKLNFLKKSYIE